MPKRFSANLKSMAPWLGAPASTPTRSSRSSKLEQPVKGRRYRKGYGIKPISPLSSRAKPRDLQFSSPSRKAHHLLIVRSAHLWHGRSRALVHRRGANGKNYPPVV